MPELRPVYPLADARNAIIEAALTAFADRGFHGATMREIAVRAGVSQGLLHHHFGGKDGLWNRVGEQITTDFLTYMSEVVDSSEMTETRIATAIRSYMGYWRQHPAAFRFNLWRLLEGPAKERKSRSEAINTKSMPIFQRAQDAGFLRSDMPPGLAMVIAGSLVQFWLHSQVEIRDALAATGDDSMDDDAFLEHVLSLLQPSSKGTSPTRKRAKHLPT